MNHNLSRDIRNFFRMVWRKLTGYRRAPAKLENRKSGYIVLGRWFRTSKAAIAFCDAKGLPHNSIRSCAERANPPATPANATPLAGGTKDFQQP